LGPSCGPALRNIVLFRPCPARTAVSSSSRSSFPACVSPFVGSRKSCNGRGKLIIERLLGCKADSLDFGLQRATCIDSAKNGVMHFHESVAAGPVLAPDVREREIFSGIRRISFSIAPTPCIHL